MLILIEVPHQRPARRTEFDDREHYISETINAAHNERLQWSINTRVAEIEFHTTDGVEFECDEKGEWIATGPDRDVHAFDSELAAAEYVLYHNLSSWTLILAD